MTNLPNVQIILPALNEEQAVSCISLPTECGISVLVVDNGSSDRTKQLANKRGIPVVTESRRGIGAAVARGLAEASAEYICVADCDGTIDLTELLALVRPLEERVADLVIGRRHPTDSPIRPILRLSHRFLAIVLHLLGSNISDLGSARAFRADLATLSDMTDLRNGWALQLLLATEQRGLRVVSIDLPYHARLGHSKITGTVPGLLRTIVDMALVLKYHVRANGIRRQRPRQAS